MSRWKVHRETDGGQTQHLRVLLYAWYTYDLSLYQVSPQVTMQLYVWYSWPRISLCTQVPSGHSAAVRLVKLTWDLYPCLTTCHGCLVHLFKRPVSVPEYYHVTVLLYAWYSCP